MSIMAAPARVWCDASSRRRIRGVALRPGGEIRIEGIPDREEHAALDFVAIRKGTDHEMPVFFFAYFVVKSFFRMGFKRG
jgi:hypothetical protein